MPKDYAKKKMAGKKRGASRKKKKKPVPLSLWLLTVSLVLLLVGGLTYLKWYKPAGRANSGKPPSAAPGKNAADSRQPVEKKSQKEEEVPLYNLHEDLTNKEVKIPREDLKLPDNLNKYHYSMPCGSFREQFRAEELKARIAMTGNNSTIEPTQYKGETWYRVQLGPFNRKRTAESVRHRLQDNNIQGCIINRHLTAKN